MFGDRGEFINPYAAPRPAAGGASRRGVLLCFAASAMLLLAMQIIFNAKEVVYKESIEVVGIPGKSYTISDFSYT